MNHYGNIDLQGNELKGFRVDPRSTYPTPAGVGHMVFKDGKPRWWDGTQWVTVSVEGVFSGGIDAETGTLSTTATIGDWFIVTEPGDLGGVMGEALKPGDILVADIDNPADISDYTVVRITREQATLTEAEKVVILAKIQHLTSDGELQHEKVIGLGELALLDDIPIAKVQGLQAALDALENSQWLQDLEANFNGLVVALIEQERPDADYKNPDFPALVSELTTKVDELEGTVDTLNTQLTNALSRIDALEE